MLQYKFDAKGEMFQEEPFYTDDIIQTQYKSQLTFCNNNIKKADFTGVNISWLKSSPKRYTDFKSAFEIGNNQFVAIGNRGDNHETGLIVVYNETGSVVKYIEDEDVGEYVSSVLTNDGFVTIGICDYSNAKDEHHVCKYNNELELIWRKTYKENGLVGKCIIKDVDGGFIVAADKNEEEGYVLKLDNNGEKIWKEKVFNKKSENNLIKSIIPISTDEYVIICSKERKAGKISIIKVDKFGAKIWEKHYQKRVANSIVVTIDGGYVVTGSLKLDNAKKTSSYILKLDSKGDKLWEKYYETDDYNFIPAYVMQTSDNNLIIATSVHSDNGSNANTRIIKIDNSGNEIWKTTIEDTNKVISIIETNKGMYLISLRNKVLLLDADGNL
jgi:hypothetical protein